MGALFQWTPNRPIKDSEANSSMTLGYGEFIKAVRGDEWLSIQRLDDEHALWLYGKGVVGDGRKVAPLSVVQSQLQAHCDHGWTVVAD